MPDYEISPFDLVENESYHFHKLWINGKCRFDSFYEEIKSNDADMKAFDKIISMMDDFCDEILLPQKKFRPIKGVNRKDIFEFKNGSVRVYVVKKKPNMYVVIGGSKGSQDKIIKWLKQSLKTFDHANIKEHRTPEDTALPGLLD